MTIDSVRLFAAFDVPLGHREHLQREIDYLKAIMSDARWTDLAGQHVTLKFLGWIDQASVGEAAEICREVCAGFAPSQLRLTELGAFPSMKRARVLWCGIEDEPGAAAGLARGLDLGMTGLVAPEERAFTPHLTLARFRAPQPLGDEFQQPDLSDLPSFELDHVVLYRSHLSPKGARYEEIERFPLVRRST